MSPEKIFSTHCAPTCMKTHWQGTRVSLLPLTFRPYNTPPPERSKELWAYGVQHSAPYSENRENEGEEGKKFVVERPCARLMALIQQPRVACEIKEKIFIFLFLTFSAA